jgi:hypothetical protein
MDYKLQLIFFLIDAPEDEQLEQLKSFKQEIIKASPKTKVIIPKYFNPIILKAK